MTSFTKQEFDRVNSCSTHPEDFAFDAINTVINDVSKKEYDVQVFDYEKYGDGIAPAKWTFIWDRDRLVGLVPTRDYFKSYESQFKFFNILYGPNPRQMFKPLPQCLPAYGIREEPPCDVDESLTILGCSLEPTTFTISTVTKKDSTLARKRPRPN